MSNNHIDGNKYDDFELTNSLEELHSQCENFITEMERKCINILGKDYMRARNDIVYLTSILNSKDVLIRWSSVHILLNYYESVPIYGELLKTTILNESDDNITCMLINAIARKFACRFSGEYTRLLVDICNNEVFKTQTRICAYIGIIRLIGEDDEFDYYYNIKSVDDFDHIFLSSIDQ